MIDMHAVVGSHDIVLITLDTLRYDTAVLALERGLTPTFASLLPPSGWEERHAPASFTFAAHQAFFTGFLPTPARPGRHERLLALRFPGSETCGASTVVLDAPNVVDGLAGLGYRTICIGGTGFFTKRNPLSSVLPGMFQESHWEPRFAVGHRRSTEHQVRLAAARLGELTGERVFLFINVSALHRPNHGHLAGADRDSRDSQIAALAYVDSQMPELLAALGRRGPSLVILCGDHGTAYGEDGYVGHRIGHPVVWTVPYAEVLLP